MSRSVTILTLALSASHELDERRGGEETRGEEKRREERGERREERGEEVGRAEDAVSANATADALPVQPSTRPKPPSLAPHTRPLPTPFNIASL